MARIGLVGSWAPPVARFVGGWFARPSRALLTVWIAGALYTIPFIDRGWVPHDEGMLGHTAERVLDGEMPHRDFDDPYTGGLTYLHAGVFAIAGRELTALRWTLFVVFVLWIPAVYYVASRFVSPVRAAAVTALAVVWSVPNYVVALPSWYNLFFAVFGVAAMLCYVDTERRRWLFAAGVCGGVSLLFKITGLYFIAGVLLFLLFREQSLAAEGTSRGAGSSIGYRIVTRGGLLAFIVLLFNLVSDKLSPPFLLHFFLPGSLVALVLWCNEDRIVGGASRVRFARVWKSVWPFAVGGLLAITPFMAVFVLNGAVADLIRGVFILPQRRLDFATTAPSGIFPSLTAGLALLLASRVSMDPRPEGRPARYLVNLIVVTTVVAAVGNIVFYRMVFMAARTLVPCLAVVGAVLLLHKNVGAHLSAMQRQQLLLMIAVTAMVSLVQFPFAAPVYFAYVAPLGVLTAAAVVSMQRAPRLFPYGVISLFALFAVVTVNRQFIHKMGWSTMLHEQTAPLELDRAQFTVRPDHRAMYRNVVRAMRDHAVGEYIYAAPDAPEVYFLTGFKNPTRTLFDFFDEQEGRTERIMEQLMQRGVQVVAINRAPDFSDVIAADLEAGLERRYPNAEQVGKFTVRWR